MQITLSSADEYRALEILAVPRTAADFASLYWEEDAADPPGRRSRRGHALLGSLVRDGKVRRISEGGLDVYVRGNVFAPVQSAASETHPQSQEPPTPDGALAWENGQIVRIRKELIGELPRPPAPPQYATAQPMPQQSAPRYVPPQPYYAPHAALPRDPQHDPTRAPDGRMTGMTWADGDAVYAFARARPESVRLRNLQRMLGAEAQFDEEYRSIDLSLTLQAIEFAQANAPSAVAELSRTAAVLSGTYRRPYQHAAGW